MKSLLRWFTGASSIPFFEHIDRLTGAYAMVLGFATTLYKFLDVGPGAVAGREQEYCQDVWWMNLLYINNFVDPTNPETAVRLEMNFVIYQM